MIHWLLTPLPASPTRGEVYSGVFGKNAPVIEARHAR